MVTINRLKLNQTDLDQELKTSLQGLKQLEATPGKEPRWLTYLIERELLVQEAQRLGMDRDPGFMKTIERFWKEALIKSLLDRMGKEISTQTDVFEPEIENYYQKLKLESKEPLEPLDSMRDEIKRTLQREKETAVLEGWLDNLRKQSKIEVNQEALSKFGT